MKISTRRCLCGVALGLTLPFGTTLAAEAAPAGSGIVHQQIDDGTGVPAPGNGQQPNVENNDGGNNNGLWGLLGLAGLLGLGGLAKRKKSDQDVLTAHTPRQADNTRAYTSDARRTAADGRTRGADPEPEITDVTTTGRTQTTPQVRKKPGQR